MLGTRILVGLSALAAVAFAGERGQAGPLLLKASAGPYRAELLMRPADKKLDSGIWIGAAESPAKRVVQQLRVWFKGVEQPVARSAYADLANVRTLEFERKGKLYQLVIHGADADDGYRAIIRFSGGLVVSRRAESGEFPKNDYEETRYVRIPIKE